MGIIPWSVVAEVRLYRKCENYFAIHDLLRYSHSTIILQKSNLLFPNSCIMELKGSPDQQKNTLAARQPNSEGILRKVVESCTVYFSRGRGVLYSP